MRRHKKQIKGGKNMSKNYLVADVIPVRLLLANRRITVSTHMEKIGLQEVPKDLISLVTDSEKEDAIGRVLEGVGVLLSENDNEEDFDDVQLEERDTLYIAIYRGILPCGTLVYDDDLEIFALNLYEA